MADYTNSKGTLGLVHPENVIEMIWGDSEPLITAAEVRNKFLKGIPLVSQMKDPVTKLYAVWSDDDIKDRIVDIISDFELETGIDVMPRKRSERKEFDRLEFEAFGYFQLRHKPAFSIDKLAIQTPEKTDIFVMPANWIETGNLITGQVNILPMSPASTNSAFMGLGAGSYGVTLMGHLANLPSVPAYWTIDYSSGFPDGHLPRVLNSIIGRMVAIDILSQVGATFARSGSHSLSIDGMSQSISNPGPELFKNRIADLKEPLQKHLKMFMTKFGKKFFVGSL